MRKDNKFKLNNNGSTFLFVVVTLIFIGLLATLIMALTVSSFRMKNVDYNSRQNFYESEEFSGRIYSEIGMNAVGILGEAYVTTMGKINSGSISNETALNQHIQELYYKNMLVYLRVADTVAKAEEHIATQKTTGSAVIIPANDAIITDNVVPLLKTMVDPVPGDTLQTITPDIKITGSIECDLYGAVDASGEKYPTITINDVHIQYVEPSTRFETNLTYDIVVRYPEWDFTYSNPVSTGTDIDTFLDYILISNNGIEFTNFGTDADIDVYGCVATGTNRIISVNDDSLGINVTSDTVVEFRESEVGKYKYAPLEIVVSDNIVLNSSATTECSMYVYDGEIWCNSIILKRSKVEDTENTNKSLFSAQGTRLYLQDDLQLDGDYSEAIIKNNEATGKDGAYFGYSNNTRTNVDQLSQDSSSAIIVNGNNSKINLSGLSKLYVSGLAYIDYVNRANPYRTGESLSVKGNQDIYMVPDVHMGENFSNPTASSMSADDMDIIKYELLNNFFGKDYLDPSNPFVTKSYRLNNKDYTFFYLNFVSTSKQTDYVIDVLTPGTNDTVVEKEIRERVKENLSNMNMSEDKFLSAATKEGGDFYAAGAVVTATGGDIGETGTANSTATKMAGTADASINLLSFSNRYRLMKSLLMTLADPDDVLDNFGTVKSTIFAKLHVDNPAKYPNTYSAVENYLLNNSAVTNTINLTKLKEYVTGADDELLIDDLSAGKIRYARTTGTYDLDYNGSGILVVDGDVEITGNFEGLIVATGAITVKGSGTLTANATLVENILKEEQAKTDGSAKSDVFRAFPVTGPDVYGESITQLKYADVLYYDNWRRYNDETSY